MSGRKQHYIPQCLLKAFGARQEGKHVQVYVYKADTVPYLTATHNIAAQRDFYSDAAELGATPSIDDLITAYESYLAPRLASLRNMTSDQLVPSEAAAEVVAHLTVRTAHLRELFGYGAEQMLDNVDAIIRDPEKLRDFLELDALRHSPHVNTLMDEAIADLIRNVPVLASVPVSFVRKMAVAHARERFNELHISNAAQTASELDQMRERLPNVLRDAHAKALGSSLSPKERVQDLLKLTWSIHHSPGAALLLPDCVTLAADAKGNFGAYVGHDLDDIEQILLPLSPTTLLIGSNGAGTAPTPDQFNWQAAKLCFTFFVSSTKSEHLRALAKAIGQQPKSAILKAVSDAVAELTTSTSVPKAAVSPTKNSAAGAISFNVQCFDFGDGQYLERVAQVVKIIVQHLSGVMRLTRLNAVVFANGFDAAYTTLNTGLPDSFADEQRRYLALAPLGIRNGQVVLFLLIRGGVASALLDAGEKQIQAVHLLTFMLARVDFIDKVETRLPGMLVGPIEHAWDRWFSAPVYEMLIGYHCSRSAIGIWPDAIAGYRQGLVSSLETARRVIPAARNAFLEDQNADAFLAAAVPNVALILQQIAYILGYADEENFSFDPANDDTIRRALEDIGLWHWLDTYRRDLRLIVSNWEDWSSPKDLHLMDRHVERWLWAFGAFLWRLDDGRVWVQATTPNKQGRELFGFVG